MQLNPGLTASADNTIFRVGAWVLQSDEAIKHKRLKHMKKDVLAEMLKVTSYHMCLYINETKNELRITV